MRAFFTKAFTSSCVMRALKPVPVISERSTPSSRAKRRTDGPAWAREKPASLIGARSVRPPGSSAPVAGALAPLPAPFALAGAAVVAADVAAGALLDAAGAAGGGAASLSAAGTAAHAPAPAEPAPRRCAAAGAGPQAQLQKNARGSAGRRRAGGGSRLTLHTHRGHHITRRHRAALLHVQLLDHTS